MFYQIKSDKYTYYAVIKQMSKLCHKVFIGAKRKCVVISVYFDETNPNIDALSFDENCSAHGDLRRGRGTVDLLNTAMAFVKQIYGFDTFEFMDKSTVPCDHQYELPLMYLHLAKYNKTWYEEKFNAQPLEISNYTERKTRLRNHLKTKPDWESFTSECTMTSKFKKSLKSLYDESDSLADFLKTIGTQYDCYLFKLWLVKYIDKVMGIKLYATTWSITLASQPALVTIEKIDSVPDNVFFKDKGQPLMNFSWEIYGGNHPRKMIEI
jgi:hypothetical protein